MFPFPDLHNTDVTQDNLQYHMPYQVLPYPIPDKFPYLTMNFRKQLIQFPDLLSSSLFLSLPQVFHILLLTYVPPASFHPSHFQGTKALYHKVCRLRAFYVNRYTLYHLGNYNIPNSVPHPQPHEFLNSL